MWRVAFRGLWVAITVAVVGWSFQVRADDQAADDADSSKATQLTFDDARSARVQGRLVGKDKHEYTFDARKGQKVVLAVSSDLSPWIGIDLLAPVFASTVKNAPAIYTNFIDGTTRWEGVVPGNGTYTVRLGLLRSQAQKVGRVDYELDVNIK
ncbi:MAG TPA: hypothetical protein PKE27_05430 [Povalibacter sp.]|uniref:hypothetical protein n=1 Tax=Povalibacter sp. TaxID=1962978 RepID=UPI002CD95A6B|nr:hypothetical protein [Povalibacter sp.]HMN43990.1 hypothetical protein [Povalibacter sp.]